MNSWFEVVIFLAAITTHDFVHAMKLSHKENSMFTNGCLKVDSKVLDRRGSKPLHASFDQYPRPMCFGEHYLINKAPSNIVWGLLNLKKGNVPQYNNSSKKSPAGNVPAIFQDLSQDAVTQFSDVINTAFTHPIALLGAAESIAIETVNLFEDIEAVNIINDLSQFPESVVAEITNGWKDFTAGVTDAWNDITSGIDCFFGNFPQPTDAAGACGTVAAATSTVYAQRS
ncbi:hypothetical protein ABVK25_005796 [Lepraria finkii]|uniref:Uncharacterized protein n=1 Tax=Lepraria finkii TaxID=1340010 RepID=A0ABR4B8W2_9LECA